MSPISCSSLFHKTAHVLQRLLPRPPPPNEKKMTQTTKIIICRITFLSSSWLKVESKSSSVASTISSIFCRLALPLLDEAEETGGPSRFTGRQRDSSSARYCILMFPNMFPKTYPVKNPFFSYVSVYGIDLHWLPRMFYSQSSLMKMWSRHINSYKIYAYLCCKSKKVTLWKTTEWAYTMSIHPHAPQRW